jgi:hypothetical protein
MWKRLGLIIQLFQAQTSGHHYLNFTLKVCSANKHDVPSSDERPPLFKLLSTTH